MRHWYYIALALAVIAAPAMLHADTAAPAAIDLLLKPHQSDGKVDYVDIQMSIEHADAAPGAVLVHMPLVVASIPSQRYDGDAIHARDDDGDLALTQKDEPSTPFLSYRDWIAARPIAGNVVLTFRATPRVITETTRNGPLFDMRAEAGGVHGAGFTFVPAPPDDKPYRIHLHWDFSGMPAGSRGIWSLGEGDVNVVRPAEILQTSFYFAGPVKSYPADGSGKFVMYWLSDPPFDAVQAATMIKRLFDYVSVFFHDDGEAYRIFMRKSPVKSGNGSGGTALTRSFMFGYGTNKTPTVDSLEELIAHEMVHNWPTLTGDHEDTSWYTEGTAEYYSILLSYRAGLITPKQFLDEINGRAKGYYTNPLQSLSNQDAERIYWKDSRAGHVPYGRGWMYLGIVDAQIRAKSHGRHSLDTVVLALLDRERHGQSITTDDWQNLVAAEIGPRAREEYADMVAGKWLKPRADEFAPCFHPVPIQVFPEELGFDAASLNGAGRVIRGLVAGSAAAQAGLQNGDVVIDAPDIGDPSFKYSEPLVLKIRRGDKELSIAFVPHGKAVPAYKWVRNPRVSDAMCKV